MSSLVSNRRCRAEIARHRGIDERINDRSRVVGKTQCVSLRRYERYVDSLLFPGDVSGRGWRREESLETKTLLSQNAETLLEESGLVAALDEAALRRI